ncbi:MAG: hypothetical protein U1F43_27145 [Myxococcota bacterium]
MLDMEKVAAVIAAARTTTGMLMTAAEIALLRTYAREALRQQQLKDEAHDPVGAMRRQEGRGPPRGRGQRRGQRGHPQGRGRRRLRVRRAPQRT